MSLLVSYYHFICFVFLCFYRCDWGIKLSKGQQCSAAGRQSRVL